MLEADYYLYLKEQLAKNEIYKFELQPRYELIPAYIKNYKKIRKTEYIADFKVYRTNIPDDYYLVDTKGAKTDLFKLKEKLFNYIYPDIDLLILTYNKSTNEWIDMNSKEYKNSKSKKLQKTTKISE